MARKGYLSEQIIDMLREVEVLLNKRLTVIELSTYHGHRDP